MVKDLIVKEQFKANKVSILNKKLKPKSSVVYDTYWKFAAERQEVFFKRFNLEQQPWSQDDLLNKYKFTNAYRAADRVSQYLISNITNKDCTDINDLFFRIIFFKIFNRVSTWEFLEEKLQVISYKEYSFAKYDRLLKSIMNSKNPIYSAAYIMASGRTSFGFEKKHQNHLKLIEKMIKDEVPFMLTQCKSMNEAYDLLLSYPTIGEFLAYQYITDINYSSLTNFSEMEFVKAGPGAKDGIRKCFIDFGDYSFEDIIRMVTENQEIEFEKRNINFKTLWGRDLQLIDCQNIFCEVDKYSRVAHPEIEGYSKRLRIKQKYTISNNKQIEYLFPNKWGINNLIK